MPAPAGAHALDEVPWGTSSTSMSPDSIRSSAGVRMPGRDENDTISLLDLPAGDQQHAAQLARRRPGRY